MKKLQAFLKGLSPPEQAAFAKRSGTTIGYLRKVISTGQKLGEALCINLERESARRVLCEDIRPDVDWAYLRNTPAEAAAGLCDRQLELVEAERRTQALPIAFEDRRGGAAACDARAAPDTERAQARLRPRDRKQIPLPFNRRI
jgi:DNA-binding transcriptional regulator YdaS (Cro superfamily)